MYQSPIEVIYKDLQMQVKEQADNQIFEAVQQCEIRVDKDELVRALQYDRGQYEKGYVDGYECGKKVAGEIIDEAWKRGYDKRCEEERYSVS